MDSTSVAIELLSDRMDVVALKGDSVVSSTRVHVELPAEPTGWAKAVRALGSKLKEAVGELDVDGAETRILYRSPTQSVHLASLNLRTSSQACAAAILPAAESLPYAESAAIMDAVRTLPGMGIARYSVMAGTSAVAGAADVSATSSWWVSCTTRGWMRLSPGLACSCWASFIC